MKKKLMKLLHIILDMVSVLIFFIGIITFSFVISLLLIWLFNWIKLPTDYLELKRKEVALLEEQVLYLRIQKDLNINSFMHEACEKNGRGWVYYPKEGKWNCKNND